MRQVYILYSCMLANIQEKEKIQEKGLLKIIPEILCFIDLTNTINSNTLRLKIIYIYISYSP